MPLPSPKYASDPSLIALGAAIRSLRKVHGISQEELANLSNVERSYVSSVERGMQNPGFMTLLGLAGAMGVPLSAIVAEAGL